MFKKKKHRTSSSMEISLSMNKQGIDISLSTVRRRLNEQSLHKIELLKKPLLSDTNRDNRLIWAKANKNTDWSKVIFTDETTISQFSKPKKVWRQRGEIIKAPIVKYSTKIPVYRYFSEERFGNIYYFTNNLNKQLLCTIYKTTLLPSAKKFFGKDNYSWILQEDNDPKHISRKTQEWRDDNQVNRMSWLSQSPDLNPIENVWAVLKANVSNHKPISRKDLIKIIKKEWKVLDNIFAKNLVLSMQNYISLILANNSDHILDRKSVV